MRQRKASDTRAEYITDENAVLAQAETILRRRLERLGKLTDPTAASDFVRMRLGGLEHEEFHVIFLDTAHCVISCERMFRGTIDGAEISCREVSKTALARNAAAVIFAHNHPSGNPEPSAADRAVTSRLVQSLKLFEIRVLDHLIVGHTVTSMAQRGLI